MESHRIVEQTAREAYGRLLSYLTVHWRNPQDVEDALGDAFLSALEAWPKTGIPDKPEAWLVTIARRRLIDRARRGRVSAEALPTLLAMSERAGHSSAPSGAELQDERLAMMLLCAHPAIDPAMRTPLMLQTVLGMDAARIASAFIVKPATMGQRLTRAKAKIRAERLTFEAADAEDAAEIAARLDSVLEAVYAAYGSGWGEEAGTGAPAGSLAGGGLSGEAIELGRLLLQFVPGEAEVYGLLALMLHCEARREARHDEAGEYVPLSEQDCAGWDRGLIAEAERFLHAAAHAGRIGRFQLMAAIQSVHAQRLRTGRTEWEAIAQLYEGLVSVRPTLGAYVSRAAAVAEAYGPDRGMVLLASIPSGEVASYQPYWALAGHLYARLHRLDEARSAYGRAIGLSADEAVRRFLSRRLAEL
ncbi:RNA polymerase sigma factor [Cohnella sp. GCM10012308]|uniref:RNA polymerase sigma factor n=1 Tax=Cohnella sp. GCM10012308 TaxID=3317329 RepID=UPI00361FF65E